MQIQASGYARTRPVAGDSSGARRLINPHHTIDKTTFRDACPKLQELGFIAGHGDNGQGSHYVVPLGFQAYKEALSNLSALWAAHGSGLASGTGTRDGVSMPTANEYALKKRLPEAVHPKATSSLAGTSAVDLTGDSPASNVGACVLVLRR